MLLDQLHQAIVSKITNKFGDDVSTVGVYPYLEDAVATPAIFIEMDELSPRDSQPVNGEIALDSHWTASIIVGFNEETGDVHQRVFVANVAAQLMDLISSTAWQVDDCRVGQAELKASMVDGFSPEWDGYFVWKVEWTNEVRVGDNYWKALDHPIPQMTLTINRAIREVQ